MLTSAPKKVYDDSTWVLRLRKQSQLSSRACSVPVRASDSEVSSIEAEKPGIESSDFKLHTSNLVLPKKRLTPSLRAEPDCAKQSQSARVGGNDKPLRGKGLWLLCPVFGSGETKPISATPGRRLPRPFVVGGIGHPYYNADGGLAVQGTPVWS